MSFPWRIHYPASIPFEIDPDAYPNLDAMVREICARFANHRAFGSFGSYLTYRELDTQVTAFAAYLQQRMGIKPGERVALMLPNLLQYPVAMLGVLRAGGVVVNVNPLYTPRELKAQLVDAGAKVLVIFAPMLSTLAAVYAETPLRAVISTEAADLFPTSKRIVVKLLGKQRGRRPKLRRVVPFKAALTRGAKLTLRQPPLGGADLAFLQYTGGTTGVAKGAMLSHRNVLANVQQAFAWTSAQSRMGEEIIITALPLYHIFALTMNCFTFMRHGGLNYLIANPRDLRQFVREMRRIPFTALTGVNTLFSALAQDAQFQKIDFSGVRFVGGGGSAVQRPVAERWQTVTGTVIVEGFGLTEASPLVCLNLPEATEFSGTIGIPVPSTECRIVADDGTPAAIDEPGELWVRGPQVMQGYWQRPEETAAVLTNDGWLKTGDIAVMRADGYFKIVDRKKDLILVSGFNVYPNEVEEVAAMHPGVTEAAAIGVPDEKTGEAIRLVVVRGDPALTEADLLKHCRTHLTNYKLPRQVLFAPELPKSAVGKILRREVRERFS